MSFRHGLFRDTGIEQFDVYNDGVIATSASTTDDIDAFLDDFLSWAQADLGVVPSKLEAPVRRYESALVAQMNINRDKALPWASAAERLLGQAMRGYGVTEPKFAFGAGRLVPAPGVMGVAPFVIEPRVGRNPELKLYYSSAPLKTKDHLAMLAALEPHLA